LLALFIAMGTTLFSCADKNGDKKKIDKVEIVDEKSNSESTMVGEPALNNNDATNSVPLPPPPRNVDNVKFVKPEENINQKKNKKTDFQSTKTTKCVKQSSLKGADNFTTGMVSQVNAEYPGGIEQFYNYFGKEFKSPEKINGENRKFRISFAVERDGSLTYLESTTGIDELIEKEVVRVLKLCPKWKPGESDGKKIKMQYSLPIVLE
ncbi:MAG: hypothetical protein ABI850_09605, partial [Flavobacterium sp.]